MIKRYLLLLLLLCAAAPVEAATYYVSKSGSDANSCATAQSTTQSNQKLTFNAGLACVTTSGSTLIVHAGTYVENNIDASTAANGIDMTTGAVNVQAASGETVWIQPSSGSAWIIRFNAVSYQIWTGINVDGINIGVAGNGVGNVVVNGGSHIRIQNSQNINAYWSGIATSQSSGFGTYYEFLHLVIQNGGRCGGGCDAAHGIYFAASSGSTTGLDAHHLFRGNTVSGFNALSNDSCVQIYGGPTEADRLGGITIDGNLLYDCGVGTFLANAVTIPIEFTNNIIRDNAAAGISLYARLTAAHIYNNTIDGNTDWCIDVGSGAGITGILIKNNACTSNTGGPIRVQTGSTATAQFNLINGNGNGNANSDPDGFSTFGSNITTAPGYTNQGSNIFTYANTSNLYNAGTTLASVTTDFLGTARPGGAAYDIGAYEYIELMGGSDCTVPATSDSFTLIACPEAQASSASGNAVTNAVDSTGADLAVCTIASDVSQTAPTLSDSKSNSYTLLSGGASINYGRVQMYYSRMTSVGASHTWTANAGGLDAYVGLRCLVFSGSDTSPLVDTAAGDAVSLGSSVAAGALIRATAHQLVVTGIETDILAGASTLSASGFDVYQAPVTLTAYGVGMGWAAYPATGSVTPTWTWSTSMDASATAASFTIPSSPISPTEPRRPGRLRIFRGRR